MGFYLKTDIKLICHLWLIEIELCRAYRILFSRIMQKIDGRNSVGIVYTI